MESVDDRIANWIVAEFKRHSGVDLSRDRIALMRLKKAAGKARLDLASGAVETEINQPFITADASGPKHLLLRLTRERLEELTRGF